MSDNAERPKLSYDERIAVMELSGAVVLPSRVHEDLKGRQLLMEAADELGIATYRDELEPEKYEAVLGWLDMRPETDQLLEVTADDEEDEEDETLNTRPLVERAN